MRPNFVMQGHGEISGVLIFLVSSCLAYMSVFQEKKSVCAVMFLYRKGHTRLEESALKQRCAVHHSLQGSL